MFKTSHGNDKVNLEAFLYRQGQKNKNKQLMFISQKGCKLKYWIEFLLGVINCWNYLKDEISCKSLNIFKIKLDDFMTAKGKIYI